MELGGFDIQVIGSYEVTYSLTPVAAEGTQGNGQDGTQDNQVITFQRTVTVKAAVEESVEFEVPELYLEQGQEEYDLTAGITYDSEKYILSVTDTGDFDINVVGDYEISYTLTGKENSVEETESVESTEEQTPKAANASQKVINFSRTVKVVAAVEIYPVNYGVATYANRQGDYTVNLGTPVVTGYEHVLSLMQFTSAKIDTGGEGISLMTITINQGKLRDDTINDATITSNNKDSATWIFPDKKSSQEIQQKIRSMKFNFYGGLNVYVSINGNDNEGFNSISNDMMLMQWSENGHYYLYIPEAISWSKAYNRAMGYKLGGQQGYLATATSQEERSKLTNMFSNNSAAWTSGTRLTRADTTFLNNDKIETFGPNVLAYRNATPTSDVTVSRTHYYWAAGPEAGQTVNDRLWADGEPNEAAGSNATDTTLSDVQGYESCTVVESRDYALKDIKEGNISGNSGAAGFIVEFGGYADGDDPGQPDNAKKGETIVPVTLKQAEAEINGVKYALLAEALDTAEAGDVVKIIKAQVTAVTNATLKKDVQLKSNGETFGYKGNEDSKIDVADDGTVTVTDGSVNVTGNTTLKVKSPVDSQTYQITTPSGETDVIVPDTSGGDKTPYVMNKNTPGELSLKIGDVTYTYTSQKDNNITMVYIPDAMYKNELVTKAEAPVDKTAEIKVDDTNSVETKGGNPPDKVTVERRSADKKANVIIPAGASAIVFGHEVGAAPTGGVTVSQSNTANVGYPTRNYVILAQDKSIVIDGVTYTATADVQKFYLGTFNTTITTGDNAEISGGVKPNDPRYLQKYTVKISPKDSDLDKDNFTVTMKKSDTGDAETLQFAQVCTEELDGSITVTIPQVTGDITIEAAAKKQESKLTINGLDGRGTVKVKDGKGQVHELKQGNDSVTVNRNEELTLTFIPNDFTDPYYADLTKENGSSFSILTELKDTTNNDSDLFGGAAFDWTEKSYQVKYTPNKAENTLEATFTHSSIMHVHVTGGTAEVTDNTLVKKETGAAEFQHVIVPDNKTVQVTLTDTTNHPQAYKTAYWKQTSATDAGTDVSSRLTATAAGGKTYTYTTEAATESHMLNVSFEEGQNVDVTLTGGHASLVQTGAVSWTPQGNNTYRTLVKNNDKLTVKVQANEGYVLKSITINGDNINATEALNNLKYNVTYDKATRTYTHTTKPINQAWNVIMDFEEQYTVSFVDQQGVTLETIPVVKGTTIPEEKFKEMQKKTDAKKADNEVFFTWVDNADGNTAYNKNTVITKNNLVLKPVYRQNAGNGGHIENGNDGSILTADDFAINLRDLKNLTANNVKDGKYANVTAFDKNGVNVTAQVTVNADELTALKAKSAGIYHDALTFTYNNLSVKVTVEISDAEVTITGRTAHTLTFTGKGGVTYQVQKSDEAGGSLTGNVMSATTAAGTGKGTAVGLDKATYYQISHSKYGSVNGKTALVDAKDIA